MNKKEKNILIEKLIKIRDKYGNWEEKDTLADAINLIEDMKVEE
jgi:hypothetical protein